MTKKKTGVLIIAAAAVLVYALSFISPEQKIARFVGANADRLYETAEAALSGGGTDAGFSEIKSVDVFPGEHAIVQFIFTGSGIGSLAIDLDSREMRRHLLVVANELQTCGLERLRGDMEEG